MLSTRCGFFTPGRHKERYATSETQMDSGPSLLIEGMSSGRICIRDGAEVDSLP